MLLKLRYSRSGCPTEARPMFSGGLSKRSADECNQNKFSRPRSEEKHDKQGGGEYLPNKLTPFWGPDFYKQHKN